MLSQVLRLAVCRQVIETGRRWCITAQACCTICSYCRHPILCRHPITELDKENPDFPPYLISHGQKIGSTHVLLATRSEVADCVSVHCKSYARNVDATYAPLKLRKATRLVYARCSVRTRVDPIFAS